MELGLLFGQQQRLLALPYPDTLRALAVLTRDTEQGWPSTLDHYEFSPSWDLLASVYLPPSSRMALRAWGKMNPAPPCESREPNVPVSKKDAFSQVNKGFYSTLPDSGKGPLWKNLGSFLQITL